MFSEWKPMLLSYCLCKVQYYLLRIWNGFCSTPYGKPTGKESARQVTEFEISSVSFAYFPVTCGTSGKELSLLCTYERLESPRAPSKFITFLSVTWQKSLLDCGVLEAYQRSTEGLHSECGWLGTCVAIP